MYPRPLDYAAAKSLGEALELLHGNDSDVKILAGGQSLIPSLKSRTLVLNRLVDITGITELDYIRKDEHSIKIGALTTTAKLTDDRTILSSLPILREAAVHIADPLVRNMGTIGGNLCHSDPANDLPAVMLALNATMVAASQDETRRISADSFFVDSYKTALKPSEILTEIEIPLQTGRWGAVYRKVKKGSGGFSIAGVASYLSIKEGGTISDCRIAMTAVGPTALRAVKAEQSLKGKMLTAPVLDNAAKMAVQASQPSSDVKASRDYRRKVLDMLVKDAVEASYRRAMEVRP